MDLVVWNFCWSFSNLIFLKDSFLEDFLLFDSLYWVLSDWRSQFCLARFTCLFLNLGLGRNWKRVWVSLNSYFSHLYSLLSWNCIRFDLWDISLYFTALIFLIFAGTFSIDLLNWERLRVNLSLISQLLSLSLLFHSLSKAT